MRIRYWVLVAVFLTASPACSGDGSPTEPYGPAALTSLAGSGQTAEVGTALPLLVGLTVVDGRGRPVAGVEVQWAAAEGHGSPNPASTGTDGAGRAETAWTLGTAAGEQTLTARVVGVTPATFSARATAGPPTALAVVQGNNWSGILGQRLNTPVVVRVADRFDNAIDGAEVAWTVTQGNGRLDPADPTTHSDGTAEATWTLCPESRDNRGTATVGALEADFYASGWPGPPAVLEMVSGDNQSADGGVKLPDPVVVRVLDAYGNPYDLADVMLDWTVSEMGGSVSPLRTQPGAGGLSQTEWTLGRPEGVHTVTVTLEGLAAEVVFTGTALTTKDYTPPVLTGLSFSPSAVDLNAGPARVHFVISATDDLSGLGSLTLTLRSPGGTELTGTDTRPDEGTTLEGTYRFWIEIPAHMPGGEWVIHRLTIRDLEPDLPWNVAVYTSEDLVAAGYPTAIQITAASGS
jgi:hypothetical protein